MATQQEQIDWLTKKVNEFEDAGCGCGETPSKIYNTIEGHKIATHANSEDLIVDINESITNFYKEEDEEGFITSFGYTNEAGIQVELNISDFKTPVSTPDFLEWNSKVYQNGTNDPIIQFPNYDTLKVGNISTDNTNFRDIAFERTGVGLYSLLVRYSSATVPTDTTKLSVLFGDNTFKLIGVSSGSLANPGIQYYSWQFQTSLPNGTISDSLMLGNNGPFINVKLYN